MQRLALAVALAAALLARTGRASDHADPMSLNVFDSVQDEPEANITDLHAFIVDGSGGTPPDVSDPFAQGNRLVISLCVRRALQPTQAKGLDLAPYTFRVHLDLTPPVRFVDPNLPGDHADVAMQRLYGGIITDPGRIAESAVLEFDLDLGGRDGQPFVILDDFRGWGFLNGTEFEELRGTAQPSDERIGVTARLFDDPFIFPRFFRRNVVGIVTSIPMSKLMPARASGPVPILLWATTHQDGVQIDHDGRSLRTQLPRFGHLNDVPPSEQARAITRVHAEPTLTEALLGAIVAPLFAHRHYDSVPDVMVYDLRKPARFPNGRRLTDDVAKTLADAGETLLLELAYAESREHPRATTNDKPFMARFPYLAPPWTDAEIGAAAKDRTGPRAPDADAIAPPTLGDSIWRKLLRFELVALALLTLALLFTWRSKPLRFALVLAAIALAIDLEPIRDMNVASMPEQAQDKIVRVALGLAVILLLFGAWIFSLGRRIAGKPRAPEPAFPRDRQGKIADDARASSYAEIEKALFDPDVSRPYYKVWGAPGEPALPIYETTFASVTEDLFGWRDREFAMLRAARRTLKTRADLRWGADRNGFRRLVHPMGVCLTGTWRIDAHSPRPGYTGYFAPGAQGSVIARYSLGGSRPEGGHHRSLGLAGKLFPSARLNDAAAPRAHFITQEDLGGTLTDSITQAILSNSPPVTLLNRGRGLPAFLPVIVALSRADSEPSERQLYEIAELEKPDGVPTSCPRFMRLVLGARHAPIGDERLDFRHELLGMIYDPGDPRPRRPLEFAIEVSDAGRRTRLQRVVDQKWQRIGTLRFDQAAASYNGDFVVHFHHPPWRRDRNDPASVRRSDLR